MFDVGGGELLLIVFAILLLFGPKKIPEIAQMIGKGMQKVKQAQAQFQSQINDIQTDINKVIDIESVQSVKLAPDQSGIVNSTPSTPTRNIENHELKNN
jgi:sec-independent protein translocase protein TatA